MPPQYKRLVRRQPFAERIKNYLNPLDFLLWLSEELESSDWEEWQRDWSVVVGVILNLVMLVARANSTAASGGQDDVFGDERRSGLLGWLATISVYSLSAASCANAVYTFHRQRHYRMFEAPIDAAPSTPSAHRVRVDSLPAASSPLRYLSSIIDTSAESRAHPDPERDVWEISIWDPAPFCLKMFCLFSPANVLLYWLLLPTSSQDSRPGTTVALTITMTAMLSWQLYHLQSSFLRQAKDTSLIHKEVLNEYDIKYVHPRTQQMTRDAGIQCEWMGPKTGVSSEVDVYQPVTIINKGFHTNPNQNYTSHFNPGVADAGTTVVAKDLPREKQRDIPSMPIARPDYSSPLRQSSPIRASSQTRHHTAGARTGDGGSLGVYSHDRSPLKKATSQNLLHQRFAQLKAQPRRESGRF